MKKIVNKLKYGMLVAIFALAFSCNEQDYLEEIPLDFYSPENSFVTYSDFESALTDLYARVRSINYGGNDNTTFFNFLGTDIIKNARDDANRLGDYASALVPTSGMVKDYWVGWYKIIANTNTILSRIEATKLTDSQKKQVIAEAKFFRAFSYRNLVYLFGGVPLILDEISAPKADFTRASKTDVLNQIVTDLTDAAKDLSTIDKVLDGKVSNIIAQHYLAETYISLGKFDEAISAANVVISDGNTSLMTSRFGARATEQPRNVFWDLFQKGNQNRKSGNKEALWVIQMEVDIPGGFLESSAGGNNRYERYMNPVAWLLFKDPDGKDGMLNIALSDYNAGGRGVSFIKGTDYFLNTLWESDFDNDFRNAPCNFVRDIIYNNPASAYFGKSAILEDGTLNSSTWKSQHWRWYPWVTKTTTPGDHPDEAYEDKEKGTLKSSVGSTYRDQYMLRLAETYLLRAEAYLGKSDKANAAKDINVVRARSQASDVAAGEVTIDYILDERARELVYEEQRRITLSRVGKLVERVKKYNDLNAGNIKDYNALFPIPYSEIEANKDAVLEQNPGYN